MRVWRHENVRSRSLFSEIASLVVLAETANKLRSLSSPKGVLFRESSLIAVSAAERSEASFVEKREAECQIEYNPWESKKHYCSE